MGCKYCFCAFATVDPSLFDISCKTVMLLTLLSSQRCQTLHLIDIRNVKITKSNVQIVLGDLLKTSKAGRHISELNIPAFEANRHLCIVSVLKGYILRTISIRLTETRLFLSTIKQHKGASRDTISRWIKHVMNINKIGVDMTIFSARSTRSASVSAVKQTVPVQTIMKTVGWRHDSIISLLS